MKAIFAGLVRNCARSIDRTYASIQEFGKHFDEYKSIVFTNDNEDNSIELLNKYPITILQENLNWKKLTGVNLVRSRRLAHCRNQYLNEILKYNFDYLIVLDWDLTKLPINGFEKMLTEHAYVGSCGTQIYNKRTIMYDIWAYLPQGQRYFRAKITPIPKGKGLKPVQVCFGGLAVIRREFLIENMYAPMFRLCEHGGFCHSISSRGGSIFMNLDYRPER